MSLSRRALMLAAAAVPFGAAAADAPQIVCPLAAEPRVLIPGVAASVEARLIGSKVYGGLCRFSSAGAAQPELAAAWEVSADRLRYVFHLRPDLVWHDSGAVTADDVVFSIGTFHRKLQPLLGLGRVQRLQAPDPHTVVLTLDAPFAPFLRQLDALSAPIVPRHVHDVPGFALDPRQVSPVGTGPFWVASWLRLARFDWFAGAKPALAGIAFPVVADDAARAALLEPGPGLLVGDAVDPASLRRLRQVGGLAVEAPPAARIAGLRLNQAAPPLDDPQVRLGLACAIDRATLLREVWQGLGQVATGPGLTASADRDAAVPLPGYDPRAASGHFAAAGLRPDDRGIRLRLSHLVPPGAPWQRLAARLQDMLQLVGVALVAEPVTEATLQQRVAAGAYQSVGFVADQVGDLALDLAAYVPELPQLAPLIAAAAVDGQAGALAQAQALLVGRMPRIWLVEPALLVVRDRRLALPGGVFGSFAAASLTA